MRDEIRKLLPRYVPFLRSMGRYRLRDLPSDLSAGLFVTLLLVPQAMAYAQLAGLPPTVGLWAAALPPLAYALFGSSRFLMVGPVALVSLIAGDAISRLARTLGADPATSALLLAAMAGAVLILLAALRAGFLVHFISLPVLSGFTSAAALLIAITQLPPLLGIEAPRGGNFFYRLVTVGERLDGVAWPTLALGVGALVVIQLMEGPLHEVLGRLGMPGSWRTPLCQAAPAVVTFAGTLGVLTFSLHREWGVAVVGELDTGLPPFTLPVGPLELWWELLPTALVVAVVTFVTAVAVGRSLAGTRPGDRVVPDRELFALGLANVTTAFTGGYPVGGSISRSAVAQEVGARSPLASLVVGGLVLAIVPFAGPFFRHLPQTVLAAIILSAAMGLVQVARARRIWRFNPPDGLSLVVTFGAVLVAGIEVGLAVGAFTGLALYLWGTSEPRVVIEGTIDDGGRHFRSAERDDVEAEISPVLVLRVDRSLYFGNAESFEDQARDAVKRSYGVRCVVLDLKSVNEIDASALDSLERLLRVLEADRIGLTLAELKHPIRQQLARASFVDQLGEEAIFETVKAALEEAQEEAEEELGEGAGTEGAKGEGG